MRKRFYVNPDNKLLSYAFSYIILWSHEIVQPAYG